MCHLGRGSHLGFGAPELGTFGDFMDFESVVFFPCCYINFANASGL